ncbi:MAG: efflux transporter outer membrane subunit [Akkermansiaceae bacterium]
MRRLLTNLFLTTWLVSGCVQMPDSMSGKVKQDQLTIPKRYDASSAPTMEISSGLLSLFSDKRLKSYVAKALASNPDLQGSAARLEESGFNFNKTHSGLFPTLDANASASRFQSNSDNSQYRSSLYSPSLDSQWELDVWGRIRAGVTASARDRDAALADFKAAQESIAAQTMQAYFNLVANEKLLALSNRRLTSFKQTSDLVNRRFEAGIGNLGELDLALTDVETTRAQVAERTDARDQAARSLAVLLGDYPSKSSTKSSWPSLKRSVSSGIPSELLMKRPDIDAAFQRILAADSRVKVAHRDLYPSFSLTASAGRQSSTLNDLAKSNFNVWSLAGNLSAPLFDAGNRRSELGAANARAKQAYASYQSTVLNAFREVENALGSEQYLLSQQNSTRRALEAARRAEERIQRQYDSGLVEILTLLDTQRRSFDTEESLISITLARYQNRVSLALALGKGL